MSNKSEGEPIRVLLADHDPLLRQLVRRQLDPEPDIEVVADVGDHRSFIEALDRTAPDIVLVDIMHPGYDSAITHERLSDTKIIVWTEHQGEDFLDRMVDAGAVGVILKENYATWHIPSIVRKVAAGEIVVGDQLAPSLFAELMRMHGDTLEEHAALEFAREAISAQLVQLKDTYRVTVETLAAAVELRDEYTGGHIQRVSEYALAIARVVDATHTDEASVFGYILHDIGKLAIPDAILLKSERLTDEEFELMKTHTLAGARFVARIPFLLKAVPIVRNHHERWDGRGYPDGLAGPDIPLVARIFTVADVLDALTTDRPYRLATSLDYAIDKFRKNSGTQFDPAVLAISNEVMGTDEAFADLRAGVVPGRVL